MTDKHIYTLLSVIKKNSSVSILTREGVTFQRIAELTNEMIKDGLLILVDKRVSLSESGNKKFQELEKQFKKTNKDEWIEKDFKNVIRKLDKNTIFVPNQNELTF
jgi:REP element-mobilizing transposase RayT